MKKILTSILCLGVAQAYAQCDQPNVVLKVNGVETTKTVLYLKTNDLVEFGAYSGGEGCSYYFYSARWYNNDSLPLSSGCEFSSFKYEGKVHFSQVGDVSDPSMTIIIYRSPEVIITKIDPRVMQVVQTTGTEVLVVEDPEPVITESITDAIPESGTSTSLITFLYPNPANDQLTIEIGSAENGLSGEIQVFNMSGQIVFSQRFRNSRNTIDIASLENGVYIARIATDKGVVKTERFVKS